MMCESKRDPFFILWNPQDMEVRLEKSLLRGKHASILHICYRNWHELLDYSGNHISVCEHHQSFKALNADF